MTWRGETPQKKASHRHQKISPRRGGSSQALPKTRVLALKPPLASLTMSKEFAPPFEAASSHFRLICLGKDVLHICPLQAGKCSTLRVRIQRLLSGGAARNPTFIQGCGWAPPYQIIIVASYQSAPGGGTCSPRNVDTQFWGWGGYQAERFMVYGCPNPHTHSNTHHSSAVESL